MAHDHNNSPNYQFVISRAVDLTTSSVFRVLDYGCGVGTLVVRARRQGLDFDGVDTFEGHYERWADALTPEAKKYICRIEDGRIDAADNFYDVVVSNQVFEHIPDPLPVLSEIARVLKPGGMFLALFPTRDTWFEGHIGVYFVHWLSRWPTAQLRYLRVLRYLGFGYYKGNLPPDVWAKKSQAVLRNAVIYHSYGQVRDWWQDTFGQTPRSDAASYMRFRLAASRFRLLAPLTTLPIVHLVVAFICRVRAGRVLIVQNKK